MKNTKNLLPKILLMIVVLTFGGCEMFRNGFTQILTLDDTQGSESTAPSAELVKLLGGVECLVLYREEGGIAIRLYKFLEDATTICLNNDADLEYIDGGNDHAYYAYTYTSATDTTTKKLWLKNLVLKNNSTLTGDFTLIETRINYPFLNSDQEGSFTHILN